MWKLLSVASLFVVIFASIHNWNWISQLGSFESFLLAWVAIPMLIACGGVIVSFWSKEKYFIIMGAILAIVFSFVSIGLAWVLTLLTL